MRISSPKINMHINIIIDVGAHLSVQHHLQETRIQNLRNLLPRSTESGNSKEDALDKYVKVNFTEERKQLYEIHFFTLMINGCSFYNVFE
jgi:hypothetical protein